MDRSVFWDEILKAINDNTIREMNPAKYAGVYIYIYIYVRLLKYIEKIIYIWAGPHA